MTTIFNILKIAIYGGFAAGVIGLALLVIALAVDIIKRGW